MVVMGNLNNDFLFILSDATPVQDPIEQEITSLANLQAGWDYGEGLPPSQETINRAITIYHIAKKYNLLTEVFPIGDGEILLSFCYRETFVDILVLPNNTYRLSVEIGIGNEYEIGETINNVSLGVIEDKFKDVIGFDEWNLSELCENSPLVEGNNVTSGNVSRTWETLFPWWTVDASPELEITPFVST
jgi:hypothetical protein